MRFEDVVGEPAKRQEALERICAWLGIPLEGGLAEVCDALPAPVMATHQPRQRRWFDKAALLEQVLGRDDTRQVMERLGYGQDPRLWI